MENETVRVKLTSSGGDATREGGEELVDESELIEEEEEELEETAEETPEQSGEAEQEDTSSKENEEKKQPKSLEISGNLKIVSIILLLTFLSVYLISVVMSSDRFVTDAASRSALLHLDRDLSVAEALADKHYDNIYKIAERLESAPSEDFVLSVLGEYIGSDQFGDLRYFKDEKAYDANGLLIAPEVNIDAYNMILELSKGQRSGATEVYFDKVVKKHCIAIYVPVKGSVHIKGVMSILPAIVSDDSTDIKLVDMKQVIGEKAVCNAIIKSDGTVLDSFVKEGESYNIGNDFYEFIRSVTNNNDQTRQVRDAVSKGEKTTAEINVFGEKYTIAVAPMESFGNNVLLVSFCGSELLVNEDMEYIRHVINVMVLAIVALVISLIYSFLAGKRAKEKMHDAILTDATLECPNAEQFRRSALGVVYSGREKYALLVANIRQYRYINEQMGDEYTVGILKFIARVLSTFTSGGETFGYSGDGKFLMLYRYTNDNSLRDKIRLIEALVNKHQPLRERSILVRFNVGVYHTFEGKRRTIPEMIELAEVCAQTAKNNIDKPFSVYTEAISDEVEHDERIEAQMEEALKNGDFKLFLQPKYNVRHDRIDSAEALVRWFNPSRGEYMFPGEFIGLFETNGFIIKLDKFIYLEVLKFLNAAAERGDNVVPISVNVSRVTAMSDDFIDFYIGNKKRSGIPDGLITLEFTESFAMENYEKLSNIVDRLHRNGMKCSIDDFGTGYSSFNLLKNIPMDELKLDRFFLKEGVNRERDAKITRMVVDLAKSINMTVVQEGVENAVMFNNACSIGVDVIQGYHYAKAIPLEEYKIFVNSNTSIKYKAYVK